MKLILIGLLTTMAYGADSKTKQIKMQLKNALIETYDALLDHEEALHNLANGRGIPTATFHGLGDACYSPDFIQMDNVVKQGTGVHVECIGVDAGGILGGFKEMAEKACRQVAQSPHFRGEFNVLGLSQGGLVGRYIVEECQMPGKVRNFVTLGTPHMGTNASPACFSGVQCWLLNKSIRSQVYSSWAQNTIAPAGYFRNVMDYDNYLKHSVFLPKLNNEIEQTSAAAQERKRRFSNLNQVMLVKFTDDQVIYPAESAWFQTHDKSGERILSLEESDFYKNDYIGLKALNDAKKVEWVTLHGGHIQFTMSWFKRDVIPFLNS